MSSDIVSSDMASDMASDIVSSDIVSSDMVPQFGRGMKILRVHKKNPNVGHSESGTLLSSCRKSHPPGEFPGKTPVAQSLLYRMHD